jgi:putative DNA primase/helicase
VNARDFSEFIDHVRPSGDGYEGRCPAHEDERPSLTFKDGDKALVVTCHRGCTLDEICGALGLKQSDLFPKNTNGHWGLAVVPTPRRMVATYDYRDLDEHLVMQVVRYEPKAFRQRRPNPDGGEGEWIWNIVDTPRVLYRLPELQGAPEVLVVEGEKDADTLAALGFAATTSVMGAGKWKDMYAQQLRTVGARRVFVISDNDTAGHAHARQVVQSCAAHGLDVRIVSLPGFPPVRPKHGEDVSDWLNQGHTAEELKAAMQEPSDCLRAETLASGYIETLAAFLAEEDPPLSTIFPDLLPCSVIMLVHGEPRARKSLAAFELAMAAATCTAPFGLARFQPANGVRVLYIQEEDPRQLTRPRLRRLVQERCGGSMPTTLYVSVRRGVDLDDPAWVERIIQDLLGRDIRLLVLDAARRLSAKTDEGPAKVREVIAALRAIVTRAGVSVIIVHHDIKPPTTGQDLRRRGQRASGGDWFAGCECPVHVERVNERESLVYPQDYKFAADPAPFTFSCLPDGRLIRALVGKDTTTDDAEMAGERGKLLEWLRRNGPNPKTAMKKAGFGWATLTRLLDGLLRDGLVDESAGRTVKSRLFFVVGDASSSSQDSSPHGPADAL